MPDVKSILDAGNQYAAAQLELHARYADLTGLAPLSQTIERLKSELEAAQTSGLSCVLCVGWGSGFLSKAAFLETENAAYRKVLKAVPAIGRSMRDGVPFPKTRRIVFAGGQPSSLAGWIRLQFEQ